MATQIQLRRGTAALWTSANPILAEGEVGYETDTTFFKIGDGVTAWASLAYNSPDLSLYELLSNKVTSISGASTDNQYPSAKLVYDQLALKAPLAAPSFTTSITLDSDVKLFRDASNTLAMRNSTTAQIFRVYNTYTDSSNYERGFLRWNANVLELGNEKLGTGSARGFSIIVGNATTALTINSGGTVAVGGTFNCGALWIGGISVNDGLNNPVTGYTWKGRDSSTTAGGDVYWRAGTPSATNAGSRFYITGGAGNGVNQNGGAIELNGGAPTGTGVRGQIRMPTLPTSSAGLAAGDIWNNAGVLNIV